MTLAWQPNQPAFSTPPMLFSWPQKIRKSCFWSQNGSIRRWPGTTTPLGTQWNETSAGLFNWYGQETQGNWSILPGALYFAALPLHSSLAFWLIGYLKIMLHNYPTAFFRILKILIINSLVLAFCQLLGTATHSSSRPLQLCQSLRTLHESFSLKLLFPALQDKNRPFLPRNLLFPLWSFVSSQ